MLLQVIDLYTAPLVIVSPESFVILEMWSCEVDTVGSKLWEFISGYKTWAVLSQEHCESPQSLGRGQCNHFATIEITSIYFDLDAVFLVRVENDTYMQKMSPRI